MFLAKCERCGKYFDTIHYWVVTTPDKSCRLCPQCKPKPASEREMEERNKKPDRPWPGCCGQCLHPDECDKKEAEQAMERG